MHITLLNMRLQQGVNIIRGRGINIEFCKLLKIRCLRGQGINMVWQWHKKGPLKGAFVCSKF